METVLITGANKGIGFEVAKQLAKQGYFVYMGCRNKANADAAVAKLQSEGITNIAFIEIDVTDTASVKKAAEELNSQLTSLDVLINNAGISGSFAQNPINIEMDLVDKIFNTNIKGVIRTTQGFLPLLKKSENPRIVNVSSDLGSLTLQSDPNWQHANIKPVAYMASKAALNAFTVALAYELKAQNFKVNSVNPGSTATDLNNHLGSRTPEFAAKIIVHCATLDKDGPSGKFYGEDGFLPW
jgi:NAD(P)-dependent dehydrogenase (short-subunit alcohol dehydrogenase family)